MGEYTVIVEHDTDEYYIGKVVELPGCHTQGRTKEKLMERIREVIEAYLEATVDAGVAEHGTFVSVEKIIVP